MSLTPSTVRALQRVDDTGGMLVLLDIDHPSLSGPVHIVNDTRGLTSRGIDYIALPFAVTLPQDKSKEIPRAQLQVDNVGRELTAELERLPPGAVLTATISIVYRCSPDTVEYAFTSPLSSVRATVQSVSASMGPDDVMRLPAVRVRFDPRTAPAVFPG